MESRVEVDGRDGRVMGERVVERSRRRGERVGGLHIYGRGCAAWIGLDWIGRTQLAW